MKRILLLATVVALMVAMVAMSVAPAWAQEPPDSASCRGQLQVLSVQENGGQQAGQETSAAAQDGGIGTDSSNLAHRHGACF
jgi:hypothetical protein